MKNLDRNLISEGKIFLRNKTHIRYIIENPCNGCIKLNVVKVVKTCIKLYNSIVLRLMKRTQPAPQSPHFLVLVLWDCLWPFCLLLSKAGLAPTSEFWISFLFWINFLVDSLCIFVHSWKPFSGKLLIKPPPTPNFFPPFPKRSIGNEISGPQMLEKITYLFQCSSWSPARTSRTEKNGFSSVLGRYPQCCWLVLFSEIFARRFSHFELFLPVSTSAWSSLEGFLIAQGKMVAF